MITFTIDTEWPSVLYSRKAKIKKEMKKIDIKNLGNIVRSKILTADGLSTLKTTGVSRIVWNKMKPTIVP